MPTVYLSVVAVPWWVFCPGHIVVLRNRMLPVARWVLSPILLLLSWLYGAVVTARGWLYDRGWLRSYRSPVPTVGVGNLTVGGTGKSPMVHWLCRELSATHRLAVLSRGYGRRTRGYREVRLEDTSSDVGDEPLMLKRMLEGEGVCAVVAVCEDRVEGCRRLASRHAGLSLIVLDDAFQHRRLRLDWSVLLTDYGRLHCHDPFLPYGRRRDALQQARRADVQVVTKCAAQVFERETERLRLAGLLRSGAQPILYSRMRYGEPRRVSPEPAGGGFEEAMRGIGGVWCLSGIANPQAFHLAVQRLVARYGVPIVGYTALGDHAPYSPRVLAQLEGKVGEGVLVVTTAKDAARFGHLLASHSTFASHCWILPVGVEFYNSGGETLLQSIHSCLALAHSETKEGGGEVHEL